VAPNLPFSHIQIVPKVSPESSANNSPQPTFRKPSYQQEAEVTMSATDNTPKLSSHLSLANSLNSGPTFAAKARAAELNAARARRDSRDLEENEVPASVPVSLGALTKFTKPRNKGKWKSVNLDDQGGISKSHPESQEGLEDSESSSEHEVLGKSNAEETHSGLAILRDITNIKNPHPLRQHFVANEFNSTAEELELSPEVQRLENNIEVDFDVGEWDPDLPSASPAKRESALQSPHPLRPELIATEFQSAAQQLELASEVHRLRNTEVNLNIPEPDPKSVSLSLATGLLSSLSLSKANIQPRFTSPVKVSEDRGTNDGLVLPTGQEAKLALLGVLPPVSRDSSTQSVPVTGLGAEVPYQCHHGGNGINMADNQNFGGPYQFDANNSRQFYGSMNFDFRFAQQQEVPQYNLSSYAQQGYYPTNQHPHVGPYPQEIYNYPAVQGNAATTVFEANVGHQPFYDGAPMTSKRDILLKSLHDVVESSRTRESTRTVLYDPVAQGDAAQSRIPEAERTFKPVTTDSGVLHDSEPLPGWKTRPVDIHDDLTPVLTNAELAVLNKVPGSDVSPSNTSTAVIPSASLPAESATNFLGRLSEIQEAEEWWRADRRGAGELRAYLNQVAKDDEIRKQLKGKEDATQSRQEQGLIADNWLDTASKGGEAHPAAGDVSNRLLIEVLANFHGYLSGPPEAQRGQFGSFGAVPEWCIDKGVGGSTSFFGEDWGAPPPRVGRDPRYRPLLHEPRHTLYEELERRGTGGDIYGRRYR